MTTEELSILITIFVSVGIIVFFISTLIKQYYHRKYKKIQMKDEESIHFILKHTNIRLGSYYTHDKLKDWIKIVSIKILHDSHGGYYIRLNDDHTVDRNTVISIYYNGYYYQNE